VKRGCNVGAEFPESGFGNLVQTLKMKVLSCGRS